MKLYSIKCNPLGIFNPPFHAENDISAKYLVKRTLDVKEADKYFIQNPDYLSLYRLGEYDDITGELFKDFECLVEDLSLLAKEREVNEYV